MNSNFSDMRSNSEQILDLFYTLTEECINDVMTKEQALILCMNENSKRILDVIKDKKTIEKQALESAVKDIDAFSVAKSLAALKRVGMIDIKSEMSGDLWTTTITFVSESPNSEAMAVRRGKTYVKKEETEEEEGKQTKLTETPSIGGVGQEMAVWIEKVKKSPAIDAKTISGSVPMKEIVHVRPLDYGKFVPSNVEKYIEQHKNQILEIEEILASGRHVMLLGDKGIGKSLMWRNIFQKYKIPTFIFTCCGSTTEDEFIGQMTDLGVFSDGVITQAIKCANEIGYAGLVFEEVTTLPDGTQSALNTLLDKIKMIVVKQTGEVLKHSQEEIDQNTNKLVTYGRLFIIATGNKDYAGCNPLNEAFKSRFVKVNIDFPSNATISKILGEHTDEKDVIDSLTRIVSQIYLQYRSKSGGQEISDFVSPREAVDVIEIYAKFKARMEKVEAFIKAVEYGILGIFTDIMERKIVMQVCRDCSEIDGKTGLWKVS